jgi:hypothetical protein
MKHRSQNPTTTQHPKRKCTLNPKTADEPLEAKQHKEPHKSKV